MDVVGAGSGVLTFITVALSSAKVIHDFVSSFRDGPQNLRQAADSVRRLQVTLQLSHSWVQKRGPDAGSAVFLEEIERCSEDLVTFAEKLRGLQPSESERRAGAFWKRVKAAFGEKELHHLQSVVGYHSQALGLLLSVSQSDIVWESREHLLQINQEIQSLDQSVSHHIDTSNNNLHHIRRSFDAIASDILTGLRTEISSNFTDIMAATSSQMEMISRQLKELQELGGSFRQQSGVVGEVNSTSEENDASTVVGSSHGDERLWDENLNESIDRLCSLVDAKEGTIRSDKAADIIDDLRSLLDATQLQVRKMNAKEKASIYSIDRDEISDPLPGDIERLGAIFMATPRVSINQAERAHPYPSGTIVRQTRNRQAIELSAGTLIISTNKRRQECSGGHPQHDSGSDSEDDPEDFIAKLLFLPKDFKNRKMIEASVHMQELLSGSSVSIPRLAVNKVLPYGSRVFGVVGSGNLNEFRLMLRRGEASFRDHDPGGASLLMYALWQAQLEMSQYLIDNGADTSHVGAVSSPWTGVSNTICVTPGSAETDRGLQCLRVLLEAGADPTFDDSIFEQAFGANIHVAEICLSLGGPFLTVHTTDESGRTPLLAACNNYFLRFPMLDLLVRHGSSLHTRDSRGQTCLHLCMLHVTYPEDHPRDYDAVKFLVRRGADVRAADHEGLTVSDVAYASYDMDTRHNLGSYRADLWDSVLAACGYDVAEFRTGWPREPLLTTRYTRQHFEALWADVEKTSSYDDKVGEAGNKVVEVDEESDLDESDGECGGVTLEE